MDQNFGEVRERRKSLRCNNCSDEIRLGNDMLMVEKGVLGPRGPVPLGDMLYFCSEECTSNYFNGVPDESLPKLPPRIP